MTEVVMICGGYVLRDLLVAPAREHSLTVTPFDIGALSETLGRVCSHIEQCGTRCGLLVDAHVRFTDTRPENNLAGLDFVHEIPPAILHDRAVLFVMSHLRQQEIESAENGAIFSAEHGFAFVPADTSPDDLARRMADEISKQVQGESRLEAARRFNLSKAITRIRSAKHDVQNAILGVQTGLKNLVAQRATDQVIDSLIHLVRRDEGKARPWTQWMEEEITSFQEDLANMGFSCRDEFRDELPRLTNAMQVIAAFLVHFHFGKPETAICDGDRQAIKSNAASVLISSRHSKPWLTLSKRVTRHDTCSMSR